MSAAIEKRLSNGEAVYWPQVSPVVDIGGDVSSLIPRGKLRSTTLPSLCGRGEVAEGE
jgi:hypothetical protein